MRWLSCTMIMLVLAVWIFGALSTIYDSKKYPPIKAVLSILGGTFMFIGALGFFGTALAATGALNWLPLSFEWPIGHANGIATMPDGTHVVPHTPSNRIQIYDSNWRFLRGWFVDASAGTFKIKPLNQTKVQIITARGQMRYVYDLNGNLLSAETYRPLSFSDFSGSHESAIVPTPFYLYGFTHPGIAWAIGVSGILLISASSKLQKPSKAPAPSAPKNS
jgi:hypothetical protein